MAGGCWLLSRRENNKNMHNDHFSRHAQQVLTVTRGQDLAQGPGSDPSIARSWLRCLEDYHLDPALSIAPT
ncbi:hypothetical protein, partial [Klebsiella pneumoniae]|uniref:hypothetical protein n=1 Tax=Klebsiella pneumoniae TaxID=573 RepID=UPI0030098873